MHHIVSLEAGALVATLRAPTFPHRWTSHDATTQQQVAERLADATIAVIKAPAVCRPHRPRCPGCR